jgi:hypothetical protein
MNAKQKWLAGTWLSSRIHIHSMNHSPLVKAGLAKSGRLGGNKKGSRNCMIPALAVACY